MTTRIEALQDCADALGELVGSMDALTVEFERPDGEVCPLVAARGRNAEVTAKLALGNLARATS
jgi:hypothetical protein